MKQLLLLGFAIVSVLGGSCASTPKEGETTLVPSQWNLGEIRSAIVDVLSYYGPVKIASRNRFQSARVPTNELSNLGREFTLITVRVDADHPHKVYVTSAIFVYENKSFLQKGNHEKIERQVMKRVHTQLQDETTVR